MNKLFLMFGLVCSLFTACQSSREKDAARQQAVTASLEGTWELTFISAPDNTLDKLYPDKKPLISFDLEQKRVSGNTSCNQFSGPLHSNGNEIRFTEPMVMTKMLCPGDGERSFLQVLEKVDHYTLPDANTLTFQMGDMTMMRFTRK